MTQREKVLAAAVGGLLAIIVLFYGWSRIQAGFEEKQNLLDSLQRQVLDGQTTVTQGALAKKHLGELALRSLPADIESAKNIYYEWLTKFCKTNNLSNSKFQWSNDASSKTTAYHELRGTLNGDARLDDMVKFAYAFYEFPYLHKITKLHLGMQTGKDKSQEYGMMSLQMDISIAVLKDANKIQAAPKPQDFKLMTKSLKDYEAAIVQRNIFFPPNKPPTWSRTASTSVNNDSDLSYELSAKDPDETQTVKYEIVESTADGARIRDGKLLWKPKTNGEYSVTVRATDSGLPASSVTQKIAIKVTDPPAKEKVVQAPKFDVATQTRVTALVSGKSGPEAWFFSRTEGKRVSVHVGDKFDLAGITGTVTAIGATFVEIESDGRRWIIGQDETLADAFKRSQVD